MLRCVLTAAIAALVLLVAAPAGADPGDPSPTWIPDGPVEAVAISGSTAYVGGTFDRLGPYTGGSAAFDPVSGRRRTAWPDVAGRVLAAAADGAGGWYIGGSFSAVGGLVRRNLAHVRADGSVDPAWAPATDRDVHALIVHRRSVYVGGAFTEVNGAPRTALAAVDGVTGALAAFAPSFVVPGGIARVRTLVMSGMNLAPVLYVGGDFHAIDGVARHGLAALALNNSGVTGFDPDVAGEVHDMAFGPGVVYAAGEYRKVNGTFDRNGLASFDLVTGAVTAGWNPRLRAPASVSDIELVGSELYATGQFGIVNETTATEALRYRAAAFDATTAKVTPWSPQLNGPGHALAVVGDTVYLGGRFSTVNVTTERSGLAAVTKTTGSVLPWDPSPHAEVLTIRSEAGELVVGGAFDAIGGVVRHNLAAIDLTTGRPTAFDPDVAGTVHAAAVGEGGVWAGGDFLRVNGTVDRSRIAQFDPATGRAGAFAPALNGRVRTLAVDGSTVYAGGEFTTVDATSTRNRVAAFGTTGALLPFDADANATVRALALSGGTLYLGGEFSTLNAGAAQRRNLAAVGAATGAVMPWNADADGPVRALGVLGGNVIAGGEFAKVNGATPRRGAAVLDGGSGAATAWDAGLTGSVHAISTDGLQVFAGGAFALAGHASLAAFDAVVGAAAPWRPSFFEGAEIGTGAAPVRAVAATPGGWVVAGGGFRLDRGPVRTARLAVFPLPPRPAGGSTSPSSAATSRPAARAATDRIPPRLSRLTASRRRFRPGRAPRRGTTLSFSLSEPARVSFETLAVTSGRRTAKGCRKAARRGRRCRLLVPRAMFARSAKAGASRVRFTGRVGRRSLPRGRYVVRATPVDAAGNRGSARTVSLRVV